jgi:ATP-dependent RNA circularization protein (DNA/RNA ligase family)
MTDAFHKFPHTPHLLWLGEGSPREDKLMSGVDAASFLRQEVVVEEKVDGANLGLSVGRDGRIRAQSRGNYLAPGRCHAQWNPLWPWLAEREQQLSRALGKKLILFGEWCYARHSIAYDALPDWFLVFDVFERVTGCFWASDRRNALASVNGLHPVPLISRRRLALHEVPNLIGPSLLGSSHMEGICLRCEAIGRLTTRAKVVSSEFIQQIEEHWSRRPVTPNKLSVAQAVH